MKESSKTVEQEAKPKVYAIKEEKLNLALAKIQELKLTAREHQFIGDAFRSLISE